MGRLVKRHHFLKEDERFCYDLFLETVGNEMYVVPKVRIADIFEKTDKDSSDFWQKFDNVANKHIDFLICDKNGSPKVAVFMAGESRDETAGHEEKFLEEAFSDSGLPTLYVSLDEMHSYKSDFDSQVLKKRIEEKFFSDS